MLCLSIGSVRAGTGAKPLAPLRYGSTARGAAASTLRHSSASAATRALNRAFLRGAARAVDVHAKRPSRLRMHDRLKEAFVARHDARAIARERLAHHRERGVDDDHIHAGLDRVPSAQPRRRAVRSRQRGRGDPAHRSMTAGSQRAALDAIHSARPIIARLSMARDSEDLAADLIEAWTATMDLGWTS